MKSSDLAQWRWQVAVPTLMPLMVGFAGGVAAMRASSGWDRVVLALLCAAFAANVMWLSRVLFGSVTAVAPFLVAVAGVIAVWLWQWGAFVAFVPDGNLAYGYFLHPQGAAAHRWVLQVPFWVGTSLCTTSGVLAFVLWWRRGLGFRSLYAVPWWLGLFFVFSLPSSYFDAQGNASLFM